MNVPAVVSGIVSLLAAAGLSGIGVHDGVLAQDGVESLARAGQAEDVRLRVVPLGGPVDTADLSIALDAEDAQLVLPERVRALASAGEHLVPVDVEQMRPPGRLPILVAMESPPEIGQPMVIDGRLSVQYVLLENSDGSLSTEPVVLLEPDAVRRPIVFD